MKSAMWSIWTSKRRVRLPYPCHAISKLTLAMLLGTAGPEGPTSAAVNKPAEAERASRQYQDADFPSSGQKRLRSGCYRHEGVRVINAVIDRHLNDWIGRLNFTSGNLSSFRCFV